MLTTFDRYVTGRFLHTFVLLFVATLGLYVVIDLFMNIDEFQDNLARDTPTANGQVELFRRIGEYYFFRTFDFFEMAGPILIVVSAVTVVALLRKSSETFPLLAAGIPAFRLLRPLLVTALILNGALLVNQEFVIPSLAVRLQTPRGSRAAEIQRVDPVYDYGNDLTHIAGDHVLPGSGTLVGPRFAFREGRLCKRSFILKAEKASWLSSPPQAPGQNGWLLQKVTGVLDVDALTPEGRNRILPTPSGRDVFIVSDVTFDYLCSGGRNTRLLSSFQLVERIRKPAAGVIPVRNQSLALHARLTRPILCLLSISLALPLVLRRESHSLITNLAMCSAVLGIFYGMAHACLAAGNEAFISPDTAAWLPVILNGMASAWASSLVQT
ncbi:MAG: LptF/LptG family permease [Planctomycetaceae bacterium]